ncbi:MAG: prepilin-type N-terminal cleavage/methylation domain-containing protein [Proteobacteria bacterium]|nr:prepilin-type N-terminal cleavage/methylation domain-containing protein [Pseudomonadota bacterium]
MIKRNGFTLIEVMIALFIVTSALLAVLSSFSYHLGVYNEKKDNLKLILLAKENLYLYEKNKLPNKAGQRENISFSVVEEEYIFGLKKVLSKASNGKSEVTVFSYVKK